MKKRIFSLIALLLTLSFCFNAAPEVAEALEAAGQSAATDVVGIGWKSGSTTNYEPYTLEEFKKFLNEGFPAASGSPYLSICLLQNIETEKFAIPGYKGTYEIDLDTHTWTVTGSDSITSTALVITGGPVYGSQNTGKGKLLFTNNDMDTLFYIEDTGKYTSDSGVFIEDVIIEFGSSAICENFIYIDEIADVEKSTGISADNSVFLNIKSTGKGGVFNINYDDECLNKISFTNCVFSECSSAGGGAIYVGDIPGEDDSHTLMDLSGSSFNYCRSSGHGGAIYVNPYYLDINTNSSKNTMFFKCSAEGSGGAIFDDAGYGTFKHMFLSNNCANSGGYGGGGMFICDYGYAGYRTVENCTFFKNSAPNAYGGALYDDDSGTDIIRNCRFEFNSAGKGGNEICYPAANLSNCEFYRKSIDTDSNTDFYKGYKPTGSFYDSSNAGNYISAVKSKEGSGFEHYKIANVEDFRKVAIIVEWGAETIPTDFHNDVYDVYYQLYDRYGVDGRGYTVTSRYAETIVFATDSLNQINILDAVKTSAPTGFTLSTGNWWIIGGVSVVAIAAVVTLVVVTKKKKKTA